MKNVYESILAILNNETTTAEEFESVRTFATNQLKEKAEKRAFYDELKPIVLRVLSQCEEPITCAALDGYVQAEQDCPQGTSRSRIQYGILHYWQEDIETIKNGRNANTYRIAVK